MRVLLTALLLLLGATPAHAGPGQAPIGGGSVLFSPTARCTAAFAATTATGESHLVAGPGCGSAGTHLFSGDTLLVGPVTATQTNGFVTIVRVTNTPEWTLVPWIPVGSTQHVISGSTETPIGGSVCLLDRSVGQRCGFITAKNLTINYAGGSITGVTRTNICMQQQSTAIAFVSGSQAQGIPIGGSTCTTNGVSYFLPIRPILLAHGLTVLA
jgi:hypothetical protein